MVDLDTPQDIRNAGKQVAEKYAESSKGGIALTELRRLREWLIPESIDILQTQRDPYMITEAVMILGELKSEEALPILEDTLHNLYPASFGYAVLPDALTAIFRTETYQGHKILRRELRTQRDEHIRDLLKSYSADSWNFSWRWWNAMSKNSHAAVYHSIRSSSFLGKENLVDAMDELVESLYRNPYDGEVWAKLGEVEVNIIKKGHYEKSRHALAHDKRLAGSRVLIDSLMAQAKKDLTVAMHLSPFNPNLLLDIGYSFFNVLDNRAPIVCYDRAFQLEPEKAIEAALHYRRGLARHCLKLNAGAYNDFRAASLIYDSDPKIPRVNMGEISLEDGMRENKKPNLP